MLLKVPGSGVDEGGNGNPQRRFSLAAPCLPSSLQLITAREECSPGIADEVGDEDDEGARDCGSSWFEL